MPSCSELISGVNWPNPPHKPTRADGNRWALEAVLEDADRAGAQRFVDLGDCVAGPLDPCGAARRLMALDAVTVLGNHDHTVLKGDSSPSAAFAREQLGGVQLDWLVGLPSAAQFDGDVFACHGSPSDDTFYLLEEVVHGRVRRRDPACVRALLNNIPAQLVLRGHTHLPRVLPLAADKVVANPGSVGCPAYDHDAPHPHVMESGSPHARYALLRRRGDVWEVELRTVVYPWHEAAAAARAHDREDWAVALETGLALPTITRGLP
jgi:diadenosine tetraphosphatase ApaH/serine/threonine PP2A family protein phosphatase